MRRGDAPEGSRCTHQDGRDQPSHQRFPNHRNRRPASRLLTRPSSPTSCRIKRGGSGPEHPVPLKQRTSRKAASHLPLPAGHSQCRAWAHSYTWRLAAPSSVPAIDTEPPIICLHTAPPAPALLTKRQSMTSDDFCAINQPIKVTQDPRRTRP